MPNKRQYCLILPLRQGRAIFALAAISLSAIVGCPPEGIRPLTGPVEQQASMPTVVSRVNQNVRAMDFIMRCGVSANGKIERSPGKMESFDASGPLFFRPTRDLYMKLTHTLSGSVEVGSNAAEFWYWEKIDQPYRYYTGHHGRLARPWETDVPLRPDQILDMLGLNELPATPTSQDGPTFEVKANEYILAFFDRDAAGKRYRSKELAISRQEPYLVSGVKYFHPNGRPWMEARMGNYQWIKGTQVQIPTRIEVKSLKDASYLALTLDALRPDDSKVLEKQISRSPLQQGKDVGTVVNLNRPSPAAAEH